MAFYKYDSELLNIVSSNLAVRRDGFTSNINFEITSNTETRIGMIVDDQFRGFMSNTNGVFFSSNNTAGFKRILGPGDLTIGANPPLRLVGDNLELGYDASTFTLTGPGSNLLALAPGGITNSVLANSNITIDGSVLVLGSSYANLALGLKNSSGLPFTGLSGQIAIGQIPPNLITGDKVALGTLTNNLLVNSNIQIGTTTVELGSGIYSIPMSNITGTLPPIQLPTDFENISLSQVVITSGNITISNIHADNLATQTANITDQIWLGNKPTANLVLSGDGGSWQLQGANMGITSGNLDIAGNIWLGQNANIIGSIHVGSDITTQANISAGNLVILGNITGQTANITDQIWLGNKPTANLALSGDGRAWQLLGANLGITAGNLDVAGNIYIGHNAFIGGNVVITGNAIIYGETTIINSNVVSVLDPVITLGGNTAPSLDDNMDRGVAFRWYDSGLGGGAKLGFFGFRNSDRTFRYIPDATDTNQAFTGANGSAHFNSVALDSNLTLYDTASLIGWGTNAATAGIRLSSGNLEVKSNSTASWQRLFTAGEIIAGAALGKSGSDNLTLDVEYDNNTIGLNGSGQLTLLPGGIANSNLANSNIGIAGIIYELGTQIANIELLGGNSIVLNTGNINWGAGSSAAGIRLAAGNLEVKSNSTAGWQRLFTAGEIIAGVALGKSGVDNLTLDVEYDNTSIGLNGSGQLALKPAGVAISNLAEANIYIGGTTYTLGQQNPNLALLGSNAVVFGGQVNNFIRANSDNPSNLAINSAGNLSLTTQLGMITLSANTQSNISQADILFTGNNSARIGLTLVDAANSVITMGGASLGVNGYGFRNNAGSMYYRNSADPAWTQIVSLNQLVAGAGIGFSAGTNTLYTLTDNTTIETSSVGTANLQVKDGGITGAKLAGGTITNDKLANTSITISGVSYALGSSTNDLLITGSNLVLFGTDNNTNIGLTDGADGNLSIQTTGNVSIGKHLIAANTFTTGVYSNSALTNMSGTQSLSLDFGEASSFLLTLAANADITLSNPGNVNRVGQQGVIYVQTPSTGSGHILRWYKSSSDSAWFFPGGSGGFAPSISVANSVYDVFNYVVISASPSPVILVTDATGFSRYS